MVPQGVVAAMKALREKKGTTEGNYWLVLNVCSRASGALSGGAVV